MALGGDSSQVQLTQSQLRVAVLKLNKDLEEFHSSDPFCQRRLVAERILREYLRDLAALNARHRANKPNDKLCENVWKRVENTYRWALSPTGSFRGALSWQERTVLKFMLEDYMEALLQDQDNPDNLETALEEVHGNINMVTEGIPFETFSATEFDIMTESLISSLRAIDTEVTKVLSSSGSMIQVLHLQCGILVDTLSRSTADDLVRHHSETLKRLLDWRVNDDRHVQRIFKSVAFCIEALSELGRQLQSAVEILNMCCREDWWVTALELADGVPRFGVSRWSRFSLAKREYEWSIDIVELAFHELKQVLNGSDTFRDVEFAWSYEKNRMVLLIDGEGEDQHRDRRARFRAMLKLKRNDRNNRDLEIKDISALVTKLAKPISADANVQAIGEFLRQKLDGPIPEVNSLPLTFRINPSSLKYVSGASGMVAKCKWLGQEVGVKTVKSVSRRRFEEQAAILATLQHPRVVRMIGCSFHEESQTGSLVMELMEFDLRTVIEMRCPNPGPGLSPFPLAVAIDIMLQIAEGMHYLREHEVLHRDLKAMNILVNRAKGLRRASYRMLPLPLNRKEYYIAKLADVGITEARHPQQTNRWRAPEVNDSETSNYQWPADVYSFAMTCYEILTGRVPFDDIPEEKIYEEIMAGKRPSLEEYSTSPVLTNLIRRCWATDPNERPNFAEICKSLWACKGANILLDNIDLRL